MQRLKGKVALMSGASRNIGKAIALTFAREGADMVLVANKTVDDLKGVAAECEALGVRALPLQADVSDSKQVNRMVQQALDHYGQVDILVSGAGIRPNRPFWEVSDEEWNEVLAVNLSATFYLARALAPSMIKRKTGNVITLGGMSTLTAGMNRAALGASKTGLHGLTRSIALELGPHGVRANIIAIGVIDTQRLNPEWYGEKGADIDGKGRSGHNTPVGRMGTPQDVANTALYLASDESSFVTGDCIICAGGAYM